MVEDFIGHYDFRQQAINRKVMFVAMSRKIAVKLYSKIIEYRLIFEPVVTATRKQSILETQDTTIDESCRFVVNIERLGGTLIPQM